MIYNQLGSVSGLAFSFGLYGPNINFTKDFCFKCGSFGGSNRFINPAFEFLGNNQ